MFAGIYHWFPKMFEECLNKIWDMYTLGNYCNLCLWSIFSNALYWISWFTETLLHKHKFPLFDDLQNVNVLITLFALVGVFQLVFYTIFSVVFLR
jgi:cytochrome c oxidase subunit 1